VQSAFSAGRWGGHRAGLSGLSSPAARRTNEDTKSVTRETSGGHSSGIPALRNPAKYVASYKARIFGTPQYPEPVSPAFNNLAMLE
jgi:hypothetical protein